MLVAPGHDTFLFIPDTGGEAGGARAWGNFPDQWWTNVVKLGVVFYRFRSAVTGGCCDGSIGADHETYDTR